MKNVTQTISSGAQQRLVYEPLTGLAGFVLAALAATNTLATAGASVIQTDAIAISAGEILVMDNVAADSPIFGTLVLDSNSLSILPGGVLDIQNNAAIVRTSPFNTIYGYVVNGYNGGTWDGVGGINSGSAASDPTHLTAVGIINNEEAQYAMFLGRALGPAAESLVLYTYYGDANLDRDVTLADFALIGTGSGWYHGDFNYSGSVDAADIELFFTSFNALHPIPEPGSLALMAAGVAGLLLPRRARRSVL